MRGYALGAIRARVEQLLGGAIRQNSGTRPDVLVAILLEGRLRASRGESPRRTVDEARAQAEAVRSTKCISN
jgi:hypothetical protein